MVLEVVGSKRALMKVDSTQQPSAALEASSIGIEALIALAW
jgi:hypothetical protein